MSDSETRRSAPLAPAPTSPTLSTVHCGECLSDDLILQYRQGELTRAQLDGIDLHLDACVRCRELVEVVIADDPDASSQHVTMFQRGFLVAQRYEVEEFVGKGGMGEVYAATDQLTGARVALKTVLCTATDDARAVRKLLDEVLNAQRVAHPHVFKIYDLHEHLDDLRGRIPFFTMEFIEGQSLRARLRREGKLPLTDAQRLARQLLAGLGAAHAKGVLHLDFKVDNVMLRQLRGEAVIMDFGLSRASDMQSRQRTSERLQGAGTLPYMSLEQLECRADLGPASDVYSFGVVLYEMLTGRLPFQAQTFRAILLAQLRQRPEPPSHYVPVAAELDAFVLKCLARAPQERFADAAHALAALEGLPSWEKAAPRPRRLRTRGPLLAALLGVVLVGVGLASNAARSRRAHEPVQEERALQQRESAAPPRPAPSLLPPVPGAQASVLPPAESSAPSPIVSVVSAALVAPSGVPHAKVSSPRARSAPASSGAAPAAAGASSTASAEASKPGNATSDNATSVPSDWTGPPPQRVPQPRPL